MFALLRIKNFTKIFFLISIVLIPTYLSFGQNQLKVSNVKKCENFASSFNINSKKIYGLSQLNKEFSINEGESIKNIDIEPVLISKNFNSIKCLGKIWNIDDKNNVIYIASNELIFQIYKLLGYLFIYLYLLKSKVLNLINLTFINLIFTLSLNYIFNFNFRFKSDLKYYAVHLEILDSVVVSFIIFGLFKFFKKDYKINDIFNTLKIVINQKVFILFSSIYLIRILYLFSTPYQAVDVIQEWLINYNYGFIRRGLVGTFLIDMMDILRLNIQVFFNVLIVLIYFIFFVLLFKILKNKTFDFYSLLIVLSPLFLNFNLFLKSTILLPKELLGYISLIYFLLLQTKHKKTILFLFVLTYAVSILTHEVNLILLPTFFYISYIKFPNKRNKRVFLLVVFLSIFLLLLIFTSDTNEISESICLETYSTYTPDLGCRKSEILNTNLLDNINTVRESIFANGNAFYYIFTYISIIFLGIIPFILNGWIKNNSTYVSLLITSFFLLSLIGLDWGRWISIIFTHLSIYFIFFDLENYKVNKIRFNKIIQISLLVIYSTYWSAPQCCVNEYTFNSQFGHILNNFSVYLLFTLFILFNIKNDKIYRFLQSIFGLNSIRKHNSE